MRAVNGQWLKVNSFLKTLGQSTIDLVFPISCVVCGKEGFFLCQNCLEKLPKVPHQKCIVCQLPSAFGKTHPDCTTRNTVDGLVCALPYSNQDVDNLIGIFKYKFVSDLAESLGRIISDEIVSLNLSDYFSEFTIIPIPLHKNRFAWRGFNQAQLLSKIVADRLNLPIDENLVSRAKNTKPQIKLTRDERKRNLENAFAIKTSEAAAGKKFLLVDDVVTSGATMNEIAKLLKKNKALEVWAIAVAHG
ncbi:MAG: ComF family protein [Candidatus Doudnabacteria bacterium]|nr:ComF family protein [Candidatus Doudnabacteria bacterium]